MVSYNRIFELIVGLFRLSELIPCLKSEEKLTRYPRT